MGCRRPSSPRGYLGGDAPSERCQRSASSSMTRATPDWTSTTSPARTGEIGSASTGTSTPSGPTQVATPHSASKSSTRMGSPTSSGTRRRNWRSLDRRSRLPGSRRGVAGSRCKDVAMPPNPLKGLATLVVDPYAAVAYWQRALRLPNPGEGSLSDAVAGKRVVVTGASSGIGRNAAERIAKAGGEVILVARRRPQLEEVADAITSDGGTAAVQPGDLSAPADVERVAAEILAAHEGVDVLVNNAGHSIRRWIADSYGRPRDFEVTINLNYLAPVRLVLAFLPGMRERRHGHVVNVSTLGVLAGPPRFSAYLASKAALDMFTRSIASEVIGDGVHATTIYMPLVRTPMIEPTRAYDNVPALGIDEAARMITRAIVNRPREVTPLPGMASRMMYPLAPKAADRLVGTVVRLLSDEEKEPLGGGAAEA